MTNRNPSRSRYAQIIERIFFTHHKEGAREVPFMRDEFVGVAEELGVKLPKNLGDILYTFRYRGALPEAITATAPEGKSWVIESAGRGQYRFALRQIVNIIPNPTLTVTKIPDATPGIITMHATTDEQALLAKVRYNRLIDIFTGVTCYSLQSHLRTSVPGMGQVETDEIYIGLDRRGAQYVFPVQAKGGADMLGIIQIEQDFALCLHKFPGLVCKPVAAQFMGHDLIAMFEFEQGDDGTSVNNERHYRLVPPDEVTMHDLDLYRSRARE